MKYMKVLGLLAVAAAALMAFAGPASAELTSPTGTTLLDGDHIHAVSEEHVVLDPANLPAIECESTVTGEVEGNGGTSGPIIELLFEPCTQDYDVTTTTGGTLEIEHTSGYNGIVYSIGATVDAERFGVHCRYATPKTKKIGTFTGGNPGTLHIEALIPFHSGSFLCGSGETAWEGDYVTTGALYVD